jgi:NAD(P)-dependent dehydrogenase (short-subunit alcohol dehydrogenase family)
VRLDCAVPNICRRRTTSIGYGASHTLFKHGLERLHLISVNKEHIENSTALLAEDLGQDVANKVVWHQCDLSDWKRVKEVGDEIRESTDRLDIVFGNSARGIMTQGSPSSPSWLFCVDAHRKK